MSSNTSECSESFLSAQSDPDSNDSFHSTDYSPLDKTISSIFSNFLKNFNVVHINAQSVPAHFTDMLTSFDHNIVHAIFISESWLKPCLSSNSYNLPGYNLLRNDRIGRVGGGVAIYLRNDILFSIISMSMQPPPLDSAEYLFTEITLSNTKLLLGVFYSPNCNINYFNNFENTLETLCPSYEHVIIMGDFNTCLLKNNWRSQKLNSLVSSCNLHILPLKPTHSAPNCIPSLLDLIIVSSPDHVSKHGQCGAEAFSFHDLIFISYCVHPPKLRRKVVLRRNFGGMSLDKLRYDASNIDWSTVFRANSIDAKLSVFNLNLTHLYDKHAPIKQIKLKHAPAPWLTDELKVLINKKNAALSNYRSGASDYRLEKYRNLRNRCNTMCRDAQRRHIHKSVENGNTVSTWKFLKKIGVGKLPVRYISKSTDVDKLNQHFTSATHTLDNAKKAQTLKYLSLITTPKHPPFNFDQFTECDVKRTALSISSNAVGGDGIGRAMIIPILDIINPVITHILNFSVSSGVFPQCWKDAFIIPIPKQRSPSSYTDYRPISILPYLSKILEKLVQSQLSTFLTRNSLLDPYQSGFRRGHSTTTALIKVTDDIRLAIDNKLLTVLTLLDFSNAFNTIDFDILLGVLRSFNISPSVLEWLHSYLTARRQRIKIDDKYSSWCKITAGVPQGGVLSPLLFSIFINSISSKLSSLYHLYADDLQIYIHSTLEDLGTSISRINSDLTAITKWSQAYGVVINPIKSQAIIIGSPYHISRVVWSNVPPIYINNIAIPYSQSVKNLGIYLDQTLSWELQVSEVSRKVFAAAGALRRLRNFLPIPTKILLAQSLLLSILDYADTSYLNLTCEQLNKLERLQNFAIRFIFGLRKYDHVSEFRTKLKWLPIRLRRNAHILSLLYCVLFDPRAPQYIKERFVYLGDSHELDLRSSKNRSLCVPHHSTTLYSKSFAVEAVKLWNSLPYDIRKAKTLINFKVMIKNLYL